MKKEKQVRSYKRRTKSGKTVTVKAHTAKYDASDKAKEVAKKEGAGKELEERKKKPVQLEIPFDKEEEKKVLDEVKDTAEKESSKKPAEKKTTKKVRPVGSGTKEPTSKRKSEAKVTKTTASTSEPAFTTAEFKEWYRGTGSAADKKVAKALRAQLGRSGYRKLEDEAIDNYSSRGHLSMFKRVSGGSEAKTKTSLGGKAGKSTEPKVTTKTGKSGNKTTDKESKISSKSVARETVSLSSITGDYHKSIINRAIKYAQTDVDKAKDYMKRAGVDPKHQKQILAGNYEVSPERGKEGFIRVGIKKSQRPSKSAKKSEKETYVEAGGKNSHKTVPKSYYKKYKEDPAYERRLEKDPKFASSEAVKGAKAELRGYGKQTPASIARQYGKDSKEYKGYMKMYSTPVPKDPKKAAVRNAVLQGFGRAGDDTCRDLLVANGYPHTHAYSKGVKEITALAKKYGIDW